jgi:deazaflavin-dependent oxidoreductase (nitroreductase family)
MRREDVTFLARAPVVRAFAASVAAPRGKVFAALADPSTWPRWFPGVRSARYASAPPHGVGTIREADVSGTLWIEEMIAWDVDRRWAYTVASATVPVATAQVESFDFEDEGTGTRVRWTLALEPRLLMRVSGPLAPLVMGALFRRAMRNLATELGAPAIASASGWDADRWMTRVNPVVEWLLRSPLHAALDGGLMLITVTGRRSGRRYTIPVGYQRDGDSLRVLVSKASRKQWWRNYRSARPIEVLLRGETRRGEARVVPTDSARFRDVLDATLRRLPSLGRQFGIAYDRRRGLTDEQWRAAAADAALVEITLGAGHPRDRAPPEAQ